jgi:hypothetical protein
MRFSAPTHNQLLDIGRFILSRLPTTGCQEPRCKAPHEAECSFKLRGSKQGEACGRRVCHEHVVMAAEGTAPPFGIRFGMCAPHARLVARENAARAEKEAA